MFDQASNILYKLMTYSTTGVEEIDMFLWYSSTVLLLAATVGILFFIFLNPNLKEHKRLEDKMIFWECIMVLALIAWELFDRLGDSLEGGVWDYVFYIMPSLANYVYIMTILQWVVFVDYCLYRSPDHIKRRYRHAAIPVFALVGLDLIQSYLIFVMKLEGDYVMLLSDILQFVTMIIELGYIMIAVNLVLTHSKESREPRFIRLSAFIVPFVLGCIFRFYDASLMALGIILTYGAVKRRDKFIDPETGFFNMEFLSFMSKYHDKNKYTGGNGILITAPGHVKDMSKILFDLKPADSTVFALAGERFLLLSEALRKSAAKMAVLTITDAALSSPAAFSPTILTGMRKQDESATDFVDRLLRGDV